MHPDPHSPLPTCPCGCARLADPAPRLALIEHVKEQIEAGTYANDARLRLAAGQPKLAQDVRQAPAKSS